MRESLRTLLGRTGETPFCNSILDGMAILPAETPQYVQESFQQLKRNHQVQEDHISNGITAQDFQNNEERNVVRKSIWTPFWVLKSLCF